MAQLFKPNANSLAKTSLLAAAAAPLVLGFALAGYSRSAYNTKVDVSINQPVPFSHQHHAMELGIECRYCHTSVEKSSFAGIPGTETCMSCHSQIWTNSPLLKPVRDSYESGTPIVWNKVNKLPEFVYFDHSIHISRGVQCNTCHGAVQSMQITAKGNSFQMAWCLECHREPERFLYEDKSAPELTPRQKVFELYWKIQEDKKLTPREISLAAGMNSAEPFAHDIADGKALIEKYGVKVKQLADCSVCHR